MFIQYVINKLNTFYNIISDYLYVVSFMYWQLISNFYIIIDF